VARGAGSVKPKAEPARQEAGRTCAVAVLRRSGADPGGIKARRREAQGGRQAQEE